jgi:glutamate/tyrosine decarboxylase-like PLP-dependent enzyme
VLEKNKYLDDKVVTMVNAYIQENQDPRTPVTHFLPPEELAKKLGLQLPDEGCSLEDLYCCIEDYLTYSVRTGHKQFLNQLWSGYSLPGLLGDLFTSLTNTSMYTYEVAPVATLMEKEIIRKMGELAGFQNPEGLFLTGGSNGNLQAMMIARNHALPELKQRGYLSGQPMTAFVSEESHYSFDKAANILGIGIGNVKKIRSDNQGRMIPEELQTAISESREAGELPFFVGATAGTTVKGAFDPLDRIGAIARECNLWFHVDGSWGGTALFSPRYRILLNGLEEADSFIWNAHKLMGLPLISSIFLVREKDHLFRTNSVKGTDYIFHDEVFGEYDIGPLSLQCGRRVDVLKLWLSWKYFGDKGYTERVERFFTLAAHAESLVKASPRLELMAPRTSFNICFRYLPKTTDDVNSFNLALREELTRKGKSFVNFARLGQDVTIRLVIAHLEHTQQDIEVFFENLIATAEELDK